MILFDLDFYVVMNYFVLAILLFLNYLLRQISDLIFGDVRLGHVNS